MTTIVISLLFFLIPNIVTQIIPLRFDLAIDQLREQQHYRHLDLNNYVDYNLKPEQMLDRMSLLSSNYKISTCEPDFGIIVQAALNQDMWAMKILI